MNIVKVQRSKSNFVVSVPKNARHIFDDIQYAKCTVDENGIHYSPVKE